MPTTSLQWIEDAVSSRNTCGSVMAAKLQRGMASIEALYDPLLFQARNIYGTQRHEPIDVQAATSQW